MPDATTVRRATAAAAIGNAIEWFDYGIYAYAAVYIGQNFFPAADPAAATLGSLLVFAVSFLIRPVGGLVWGSLGDRIGRQRVLATTILLMAGATSGVGVLPGYGSIGILAPVLLILLRMIQGFSTGGEYGGAATFMSEYAPDRKRGLFGSFLESGTLSGFTLGAVLVLLAEKITGPAMADWGWRLPFLVAAPLGLIGLYLRRRLDETPVFRELDDAGETVHQPGAQLRVLSRYWRSLLLLMGLVGDPQRHQLHAAGVHADVPGSRDRARAERYADAPLFGGTAPAVNQYLITVTGGRLFPAHYLMGACVIGAVALVFVPETRGLSLRGRKVPGT